MSDKEIAVVEPQQLLAMAVTNGADIPQLKELMDLQERWEANQAKKDFNLSMAHFQAQVPEIKKTKTGYNNVKYADLDDIITAIREPLAANNLSFRFETSQGEGQIAVHCYVTHISGHQECTAMQAEADTSGSKNAIQAIASTLTYLRRYCLTGALGLSAGVEDSDGGKPAIDIEELLLHNKVLRENIETMAEAIGAMKQNDLSTAKQALSELLDDEKMILYRAPTKGGMFSTEQRETMKTTEWRMA